MNMQEVYYVKIDENGDPISAFISPGNMWEIMDKKSWDFTEEEVRALGYAPVVDSMRHYLNGEGLIDIEPGEIVKSEDGTLTQVWIETPITNEEKRNRFMERKRHSLLFQSDWTQVTDSPLSPELKAAWAAYRQALRDLPSNVDWDSVTGHDSITWPLPPGVEIPDPGTPE